MSKKIRLDLHLLTKGLVESRQKANQLIRAGMVRDEKGQLLDKPGTLVSVDLNLKVEVLPRFVSRGGEKLLGAFENFPIDVSGKVCLDAGISTGGFTDCLLQHGASRVYGIDVGYGQTAWRIRNDPRVVLKERTNLRKLSFKDIFGESDVFPSFAVADLSFISLKMVIPVIKSLLNENNSQAIFLIKPQFEVGRGKVGKGGVVKDGNAQVEAITSVMECSMQYGFKPNGLIASPLTGAAGNHEYLLWLASESLVDSFLIKKVVENTLH